MAVVTDQRSLPFFGTSLPNQICVISPFWRTPCSRYSRITALMSFAASSMPASIRPRTANSRNSEASSLAFCANAVLNQRQAYFIGVPMALLRRPQLLFLAWPQHRSMLVSDLFRGLLTPDREVAVAIVLPLGLTGFLNAACRRNLSWCAGVIASQSRPSSLA